ncbi:hypothetical protein CYMTET_14334 [Cymbomonas tetramitiformis]|uniref:Amine oxidase domain-containing protein n=1 Tax=Cymbomonas tetramitiformis TaxID=36881 RepID=A0AAE0GGJ9_9CHLO|nr:hypothetical protein CYMTET_14334 [Cymbomonas tetramitiformis]
MTSGCTLPEQMKHYNLVANRTVTPESLGQALQHLTTHACWENIQTRSGALRKYDQWCFEDCDVPKRFDEIRPLILALLGEARNAEANVGEIHPIQCFLCLYEDGSMSCPAHTHGCRQLTLSLGATRNMIVNGKECTLKNGDLILLNGERHAISAEGGVSASAPRVSINIFYTTASKPDATVNGYYEGSPYHLSTRPSKLSRKASLLSPATPAQAVCALPAHQPPMETADPPQATADDDVLNRSARMLRAPPGLEGPRQHVELARSASARDAPVPRPVWGEERQAHGKGPGQPGRGALKVCVIGGGAAGLGCCKRLSENGADVEITMIVEGRGIGGRICTKYPHGATQPSISQAIRAGTIGQDAKLGRRAHQAGDGAWEAGYIWAGDAKPEGRAHRAGDAAWEGGRIRQEMGLGRGGRTEQERCGLGGAGAPGRRCGLGGGRTGRRCGLGGGRPGRRCGREGWAHQAGDRAWESQAHQAGDAAWESRATRQEMRLGRRGAPGDAAWEGRAHRAGDAWEGRRTKQEMGLRLRRTKQEMGLGRRGRTGQEMRLGRGVAHQAGDGLGRRDDPSLAFDFGVQRIELRPPLLTHLRHCEKASGVQLVAQWPGPGRLKKLVCTGQQLQQRTYGGGKGRQGGETSGQGGRGGLGEGGHGNMRVQVHAAPDATTVVGVPNMGVIGRSLAGSCPGLTVHGDRTARVVGRNPASKRWMVEWGRATPTGGQARARGDLREEVEAENGEFDVVVLAFEAKKIAQGCASGYKRIQASASQRIGQGVRAVHHHQQWALLIAFQAPTNASFDAADVTGHDIIMWVANNSSKPGREPVPECWVVHTTPEWASRRKWDRGEVERVLTRSFLQLLTATGARTPAVAFSMSSRWGACTSPPGARATPPGPQWDDQEWMGACGDWCKGVTVCDAYEAGAEMAQEVIFRTR